MAEVEVQKRASDEKELAIRTNESRGRRMMRATAIKRCELEGESSEGKDERRLYEGWRIPS